MEIIQINFKNCKISIPRFTIFRITSRISLFDFGIRNEKQRIFWVLFVWIRLSWLSNYEQYPTYLEFLLSIKIPRRSLSCSMLNTCSWYLGFAKLHELVLLRIRSSTSVKMVKTHLKYFQWIYARLVCQVSSWKETKIIFDCWTKNLQHTLIK